jgi:hypothetical protein
LVIEERFVCPNRPKSPANPTTRGGASADVICEICREFLHSGCGPRFIRVGEIPGSNPGAPTQKTQHMLGFLLGELGAGAARLGTHWSQRRNTH